MHTAYLLIGIDTSTTPPTVRGVDITSDGPQEMTLQCRRTRLAEVTRMESQVSYQEARDDLKKHMESDWFRHHHAWLWKLIDAQGGIR